MHFLIIQKNNPKEEKNSFLNWKAGKNRSKFSIFIFNPTYDNTFKIMLGSNKSILKSLLNSVLFPKSKLIEKIEYSKTYFPGKGFTDSVLSR